MLLTLFAPIEAVQLRMTSVTPLRLVSRLFKPVSPVRTITLAYVTKQCDKGSTETYNSSYEPDIGNLYTEEHLSLRKTVRKVTLVVIPYISVKSVIMMKIKGFCDDFAGKYCINLIYMNLCQQDTIINC